jgi:hypothetical protein
MKISLTKSPHQLLLAQLPEQAFPFTSSPTINTECEVEPMVLCRTFRPCLTDCDALYLAKYAKACLDADFRAADHADGAVRLTNH